MKIDKNQVLDLIKSKGDSSQLESAKKELPDSVDTEKDSGLLSKFGVDISDLAGKIPGAGGLGL